MSANLITGKIKYKFIVAKDEEEWGCSKKQLLYR